MVASLSRRRLLGALLGAVATGVLLLAIHRSESDFDLLWYSARHLVNGRDPYPLWREHWKYPLYYPLPAVLMAVPFAWLPLVLARTVYGVAVGALFGAALQGQPWWRWSVLLSGAYVYAALRAQPNQALLAAALMPTLGGLFTMKPNSGLVLFAAYPSRKAVVGSIAILAVSLTILPRWPIEWHQAVHGTLVIQPAIQRPWGWLLLLGLVRWREPRGRLLAALAVVPLNSLPHETLALCLIPASGAEMAIYCLGTWIATAATMEARLVAPTLEAAQRLVWPWLLGAVYLPMLVCVLRPSARKHPVKREPTEGDDAVGGPGVGQGV
jgi:hypothetical protein